MQCLYDMQYNFQPQCATAYQWQQQMFLAAQQQYQLQYMNMYRVQPQQTTPVLVQKKLVIFDWDDTIFPTTALIRLKERVSGAELERFGKSAYELLVKYIGAFSAENLFLVTNGKARWIEQSLEFLSKKQRALSGHDYWAHIQQLVASHLSGHVISARSLFEAAYPKQTALWKTLVFQRITAAHFAGSNAQSECVIISIGDSYDEFEASLEAQKMLKTGGLRTVHLVRLKLKRSPSRDVMLKQFEILSRCSGPMTAGVVQSNDIRIAHLLQSG